MVYFLVNDTFSLWNANGITCVQSIFNGITRIIGMFEWFGIWGLENLRFSRLLKLCTQRTSIQIWIFPLQNLDVLYRTQNFRFLTPPPLVIQFERFSKPRVCVVTKLSPQASRNLWTKKISLTHPTVAAKNLLK